MVLFSEHSGDHEKVFYNFAKKNKGKIIFAQSRINFELGNKLSEYLQITDDTQPCVKIIHNIDNHIVKYDYTGKINQQGLDNFLLSYENDLLERNYRSQDAPLENNEDVKVVVGKTFNEMVVNSNKDVLVTFCAEYHWKCHQFRKQLDEVAKRVSHLSDRLSVVYVDSSENEVPEVPIKVYTPVLKFFKNGEEREVLDYDS